MSIIPSRSKKKFRQLTTSISGASEVKRQLERAGEKARKALLRVVNEMTEEIRTESLKEVPRETGALANSCDVKVTSVGTVMGIVEYGHNAPYALAVHEIPPPPQKSEGGRSARHGAPYGHGGKWKYLEDPFNRIAPGMPKEVAKALEEEFGS